MSDELTDTEILNEFTKPLNNTVLPSPSNTTSPLQPSAQILQINTEVNAICLRS